MPITILEVSSRKELKDFIAFPEKLYKDSQNWVNALWKDEYDTLLKDKNPAFEYCEAWYFVAKKGNETVGRVAAIVNHNANRDWNEKYMRFGWLDFVDDMEVSAALMGKVEELAVKMGMTAVNGPFGFTDMDREGMLVDGFENRGSFTTLYNFPYYRDHLERLGYLKDADWHQREYDVPGEVPDKLRQYSQIIKKRYNVRMLEPVSRKTLRKYGIGLFEAYNKAFVPLYGFSPLTQRQIESYVDQFLPMINFDLIAIVINNEDKVVAFAITMPNISLALKKCRGKLFPFGFLHILKALKSYEFVDMLMIGVVPEYQLKGLNAVIFDHLNTNFIKLGVKKVVANPQLDNNTAVQNIFDYYEGKPFMTRRCFIKELN
ncbi:MAG: hypothetical protein AB9833_07920 [Bacteroidales bacterium]